MLSNDLYYLKLLCLDGFTQVNQNPIRFNFRCPVCGDSKKDKRKKRGNAQVWEGVLFIKCFNCGYSKSFNYFLRTNFPLHYKDYLKDNFKATGGVLKKAQIKGNEAHKDGIVKRVYPNMSIPTITSLESTHKAYEYVMKRKIPKEYHDKIFYTNNFRKFTNKFVSKFIKTNKTDERLVIPFYDKFKRLVGFQGRTLSNNTPKYYTIKLFPDNPLLYGVDTLDTSKQIYVVEGPIDSMFLKNSIATRTAISKYDDLLKLAPKDKFVLIYDNEPRNKDTCAFMEKALNEKFQIVIWNKKMKYKDINEMIKNGLTIEDIYDMIDKNTYSGLKGLVELKKWKRIK